MQSLETKAWHNTHSIFVVVFLRLAVGFCTSTAAKEHVTQTAVESLCRRQELHT